MKLLFYTVLPDIPKCTDFEGSQALPFSSSDIIRSVYMKMSTVLKWNDTKRGKLN
jgi:hypothetical protein